MAEEPKPEKPKTTLGYLNEKRKDAVKYIGNTQLVNATRRNVVALKRTFTDGNLDKDDDKEANDEPISQTLVGDIYHMFKTFMDIINGILSIPFVSPILFCIFAILFGIVFFNINIFYNGPTNKSVFVGYCVFAWIVMFLVLIVICQLIHSFRRQTMIA